MVATLYGFGEASATIVTNNPISAPHISYTAETHRLWSRIVNKTGRDYLRHEANEVHQRPFRE